MVITRLLHRKYDSFQSRKLFRSAGHGGGQCCVVRLPSIYRYPWIGSKFVKRKSRLAILISTFSMNTNHTLWLSPAFFKVLAKCGYLTILKNSVYDYYKFITVLGYVLHLRADANIDWFIQGSWRAPEIVRLFLQLEQEFEFNFSFGDDTDHLVTE